MVNTDELTFENPAQENIKKHRKSQYDLGETLHSCSGVHLETLYQVSPKSHNYKSQHWQVNISAPNLRKHQKQRKSQCDLGETLHSCSGIHLETLCQVFPKSHKYKSQHWPVNISTPRLQKEESTWRHILYGPRKTLKQRNKRWKLGCICLR